MNDGNSDCDRALSNVRQGLRTDGRFPQNVFVGDWAEFRFFDSDWMRAADFVDHVHAFLDIEQGRCACLWKIDSEVVDELAVFFVRGQTTADEYRALLGGNAPGYGWLDAMERLACASDRGEWCMYCEPNNEIAVIGFRQRSALDRYSLALAALHALPIETAIQESLSYGFSERGLSPEWRRELSREYAPRAL